MSEKSIDYRLVIYGAGNCGKDAYWYYGAERVIAFCDSDENKWGKVFLGKTVISPAQLFENKYFTVVAIRDTKENERICDELNRNKVKVTSFSEIEEPIFLKLLNMIDKRPFHMNIETYNYCPMKCVFCPNRILTRNECVMSMDMFESIICQYISDFSGGPLGIGSMQSDFLSDPLLIERVRFLFEKKSNLWIYSTTPLLSMAKYSDSELIEVFRIFDFLEISAHGYDRDSYRKMAGVDGFMIFECQLERLNRLIKRNNLKVDINILFRAYDEKEYINSEFYKKCISLFNVSEVKTSFFSWFGTIKSDDIPEKATIITRDNSKEAYNCVVPNANIAIQSDGKVVGCGCIDWLSKYVIGYVNEQSIDDIWHSEKAVAFRKSFERRKLPDICKECALYCPITELKDVKLEDYQPLDGLYYYASQKNEKRETYLKYE